MHTYQHKNGGKLKVIRNHICNSHGHVDSCGRLKRELLPGALIHDDYSTVPNNLCQDEAMDVVLIYSIV